MKTTCWKLFSYLTIDHQAAQDFLNEMAAEGWQLDLIVLKLFARFKRTERTDLSYYLDWADPKRTEDPDYIRMCAESGWYIKDELGYWNLYESRPGFSPAPIQTDPELEYQRFRKKTLRRAVISGAISGGILLLYFGFLFALLNDVGRFRWEEFLLDTLCRNILVTFALAYLPLMAAVVLVHLGIQLRRIWVWKQALRIGVAPIFSRKAAEVWKGIHFLYFCFSLLLFLAMLAECLVNEGLGYLGGIAGAGCLGFWYMMHNDTDRLRFQSGLLTVVLGASLLLAGVLHTPFRSVFPGRFPAPPLTETGVVGRVLFQNDAPLGSSKDWLEEDGDHRYWFTARTWAIPALAERDAKQASEGMYPVQGQQGVWIREHGVALFFRGNTIVEVICGEENLPDTAFSDMVWAWMEKIK